MQQFWSHRLFSFYQDLRPLSRLPQGVSWLYPQQNPQVLSVLNNFLQKYYSDSFPRTLLLGINPGRFGAGITGVNFTAARQLTQNCGIDHPFPQSTELSAEFIYAMIEKFGGPTKFYRQFFIGSVCPLGFVREGKNLNYYDDPGLFQLTRPFIVENLDRLFGLGKWRKTVFCIGGEKNLRHLSAMNAEKQWTGKLVPLPHPRFIMQYRRREVDRYIDQYLSTLSSVLGENP